jgi:hypothetical protein
MDRRWTPCTGAGTLPSFHNSNGTGDPWAGCTHPTCCCCSWCSNRLKFIRSRGGWLPLRIVALRIKGKQLSATTSTAAAATEKSNLAMRFWKAPRDTHCCGVENPHDQIQTPFFWVLGFFLLNMNNYPIIIEINNYCSFADSLIS